MKKLAALLTLLAATFALPALALDLHTARSQGSVGEKSDGYVSALKSTPEVQALVADVNAKRQQQYKTISAQNGQSPDVVGKLAAAQIIQGLGAGESYQDASGNWKTR